jgi:hypothetical protein
MSLSTVCLAERRLGWDLSWSVFLLSFLSSFGLPFPRRCAGITIAKISIVHGFFRASPSWLRGDWTPNGMSRARKMSKTMAEAGRSQAREGGRGGGRGRFWRTMLTPSQRLSRTLGPGGDCRRRLPPATAAGDCRRRRVGGGAETGLFCSAGMQQPLDDLVKLF